MSGERLVNYDTLKEKIDGYLSLEREFVNPPEVTLKLLTRAIDGTEVSSRDVAISTAYQCYSPGISEIKARPDAKAQNVADSTLDSGHHTTRQHTYFSWRISCSRSAVHEVLHAHPFYNSEQQSQRYAKATEGNYLMPSNLNEKQKEIYTLSANYANSAYFELLDILEPSVSQRIEDSYPKNGWENNKTAERLNLKSKKIAQEIARYALPIGQNTVFIHTLSSVQLLRLFRAEEFQHFSKETKYVIAKTVKEACLLEPDLIKELRMPLEQKSEEEVRYDTKLINGGKNEFDRSLGDHQSLLTDYSINIRKTLANGIRRVKGIPESELSDSAALVLLLHPKYNKLLADVYDIGMLDPLNSVLRQVHLTFDTRLSHAADSQRQRHRRTPGIMVPIEAVYDGTEDYMSPLVVREDNHLQQRYSEIMHNIYRNVERAIDEGIPKEYALLLLPNAQNIRMSESGDMFDWIHRWKQRLCYTAQEEIFFASVDQVEQVSAVLPEAVLSLMAPCGIRQNAGIKPRCPEGDRWCGRTVYMWNIEEYKKNRLI